MIRRPLLHSIARDRTGGALVEFALLAPVFIAMIMGVVQIGIYMQNYSALRSVASDSSRLVAVEYQKNHNLAQSDIESDISGMAVTSPYFLNADDLTVTAPEVATDVNGARKYDMTLSYAMPTFLSNIGFGDLTITYERPLYVIDNT